MAIKTLKCTVVMMVIKNNSQFLANNASNRKAKGKLAFARKGQEDKSLALVFLVLFLTKMCTLPENYWILSLACQKLELDPSKACELERQKRTEIDLEIDHGPQKNLTGTLTRSCSAPYQGVAVEPIKLNLATIFLPTYLWSTKLEKYEAYQFDECNFDSQMA